MAKTIWFVRVPLVLSEIRLLLCPKETVEKYSVIKSHRYLELLTVTFKTLGLLQGSINTRKGGFMP